MWSILFGALSLPVLYAYDVVREWWLARWHRACYVCRFRETSWWYWSPLCGAVSRIEDWVRARAIAELARRHTRPGATTEDDCGCGEG